MPFGACFYKARFLCMVQAMKTIKENKLFKRLYYKGKKVVGKQLVLYYLPTKEEGHIGYTVRKKIGKAVVRNKVRRIIKESFRGYEKSLRKNCNFVIVARTSAKDADFKQINDCLKELLLKAELI